MPKEDKISLIVESYNSSSSELWVLWKQRSQKSSNPDTNLRIKVVQDKFRNMFCCNSMMLNLLLILDACNFKNCKHTFQMANQEFPSVRISQNHNMSIVQCLGILVDLFEFHISSGIKGNVVKDHHDFFKEIIYFDWRFKLGCNQNFDWGIIFKYIVELIKHRLVIFFNKLLTSLLLIFNSDRFLSKFFWQFLSFFSLFHLNLILNDVSFVMNFDSFLLIFNLIRLLFKCRCKLLHALWTLLYNFLLGFSTRFLLM